MLQNGQTYFKNLAVWKNEKKCLLKLKVLILLMIYKKLENSKSCELFL